ncbi:hypothetical protein [Azohydromonas lata]|uniref:hypothetical protein n=1 Tax=Azohydromonas lata TaxID=45677 RepID=UPI0012F4FD84|nr:hypothetical protein [Azohydromonas lata]
MERLFPFNVALNAEHGDVLAVLAGDINLPVERLYIGDGASGPAVFYTEQSGNTLCACSVGSAYWIECHARAVMKSLLLRL